MLISLSNIHKYFNGEPLLKQVCLTIEDRDRIGLVGVNGCGKTTLLRILTGQELPDRFVEEDGQRSAASKLSIGYLAQTAALDSQATVLEEMQSVFASLLDVGQQLRELERQMQNELSAELETHYTRLSARFEAGDGYLIDVKIKTVLSGMGFPPETYHRPVSEFSGGEKTRLALAKLLLEAPNLLILDEPTNHLDVETIRWLEEYLREYRGALLIVSHDRYFLDKLCTSICEIERGCLTRYKGNYTAFTKQKAEAVARQQKEYEQQQKEIAKLEDYVARNLVRASTSKSAQSRQKALERMERIEKPAAPPKAAKLRFSYETEPPFDVLQVRGIDISVGEDAERRTLVEQLSFEVKRGERLGIVGSNGIGKSTLLRILQEQLPHRGTVRWSSNIKLGYFDQESSNLNPYNTVLEELHSRWPSMTEQELRNVLGQVRLTGENVMKQTGVISGGERAKLCFAILMLTGANVLLLDEPTNHLDIYTREVLEEALCAYTGTVLFVSHDRYLLNRLADRILEIRPKEAELFPCGYEAWQAEVLKRQQAQEAQMLRQKQAQAAEAGKRAYRSKAQRSQDAQRRARIKALEQEISQLETEIAALEVSLTEEAVYSDYQRSQAVCAEIAEKKAQAEADFEALILLEEPS